MPSKNASNLVRMKKATSSMTATAAAQSVALVLHLEDISRLALALALAAADEVEENSRFASRVRATYEILPPSKTRGGSGGAKGTLPKALTATLTPIKRVEGGEINPLAPLDPYLLLEVYGPRQLRDALDLYPVAKVREGAAVVAERHPGQKLPAKASKATLIDFIVARLASDVEPA